MRKSFLASVFLAVVLMLFPVVSHAALCINVIPFIDVLVIEPDVPVASPPVVDRFIPLFGEDLGFCGPGTSAPFDGVAHMKAENPPYPEYPIHFGISIHGIRGVTAPSCLPAHIEGWIDLAGFGMGNLYNLFGVFAPVTFAPVPCPVILPESVEEKGTEGGGIGGGTAR